MSGDWRIRGEWQTFAARENEAVEVARLMIAMNQLDTLHRLLRAALTAADEGDTPRVSAYGDQVTALALTAGVLKEAADSFRQLNAVATRLFAPLKGQPPALQLAELRKRLDPSSETWTIIKSIRSDIAFHWDFKGLSQAIAQWPAGKTTIMMRQTAPSGRVAARYLMGDNLVAKAAFTHDGVFDVGKVCALLRDTSILFVSVAEVLVARFLTGCGFEMEPEP
jgi:hypothetical protein